MTQIDLISNEWLDIMFENRNRNYGAYVLRMETGRRNVIAILGVLVFVGIAMAGFVAKNAYDGYVAAHTPFDQVTEIDRLVDIKKEAEVKRNKPVEEKNDMEKVERVKHSIKFVAPIIKEDNLVEEKDEMRTMDELNNSKAAIGFADVIGNDENGELLRARDVLATEPVVKVKEEENKVFKFVEEMPSFPGGQSALMAYLAKTIRYPAVAQEAGIFGRVTCQFVVGKDGSISDVQVVKSVDPSLDKEAVRVISSMPRWIPGRQNGSAVRVRYTVPITFRLN